MSQLPNNSRTYRATKVSSQEGRQIAETGSPGQGRPGLRYYLLALLLCLIWGMNFVVMKVAIWGVGPYHLAWLRQLLAGLCVLLYLRLVFGDVSLRPALWPLLLINGLVYSLSNVAVSLGVSLTTASRAVVIVYAQPLFVALLAHFILKGERLGALKLLGVALAFSGVVLVFSEKLGGGALRGDLFVLACAIIWALQTIYLKLYLSRENPYVVTAWQGLAGVPLLFALGLVQGTSSPLELSLPVILAILYSGPFVLGFAIVLWVKMLQEYPASHFSCILFLTPVFGVLIGHLTLGDPLGGAMILGAVMVCGGIYLVNRPAREPS